MNKGADILMNKQSIARTLLAVMISVLTIFSGSMVFGADSTVTVEINGKSVVFNDQQPIIKDG